MEYARITSRHFSTEAHEYYVTPQDVVDAIPVIAAAYDEPFGNASAVPTYFCARMARADGVRVMLAGDGGDEIFGGNARYAKQKVFEAYWAIPAGVRRALIEPLAMVAPGAELHPAPAQTSELRSTGIRPAARSPGVIQLSPPRTADGHSGTGISCRKSTRTSRCRCCATYTSGRHSASPVNRMMHLDLKYTLADNDLRKVSRMCEVAGVEVRYPLLDEALVEFSGELAASLQGEGTQAPVLLQAVAEGFSSARNHRQDQARIRSAVRLVAQGARALAELVNESLARLRAPRNRQAALHRGTPAVSTRRTTPPISAP